MSLILLYLLLISILLLVFVMFFLEIKKSKKTKFSFISSLSRLKEDYLSVQEEKNKILSVIDNLQEGILILDEYDKIISINPKAEEILGIKGQEILKKPISEIESFRGVNSIFFSLLSHPKVFSKKEAQVHKNLVIEISVLPLVVQNKNIGKLIVLHDITKWKKIENNKTDFVSLAAHQLNMPLSAIKLSLEMLMEGSFGKMNKEQKNIMNKLYQKNKTLIYLVNDLLDVAKVEDGGYSYNWALADVEDLVDLVVSSNQEEIKGKKIKFKLEKPKEKLPKVILDKQKMFLAMKNIFDNAVKYTPVGGSITFSFRADKEKIDFKVKDSGIGIPEYQHKKLFTKFFRGINAIESEIIGSGLGLFVTKNIIEEHNGKIWFESKEGQGSTFFFTIPIKEGVDSSP